MNLALPQLIAAGINPTVARAILPHLVAAFARFEINTPRRVAAFIGQYSHETSGFTRLEENLYYTDPTRIAKMFSALRQVEQARAFVRLPKALANKVYANRNGNGDEASGDGWIYRGRGLPQLTGRGKYRRAGEKLGLPLEQQPDRVADLDVATLAGAWYWHANGLNARADLWQLDTITRAINGAAMAGRTDRAERCNRALEALLSTPALP
ncbi:glycoside hydrolase family 19 protein [Variovorax sp. CY25R-8]|uniref:glycoside hydrolase family 19 protein n=1 Tax=Variovorax sp. CY25R-8 TaxID=2855501 RepID=UPI0021BA41BC|nr:glycoside hydrolase family 19 protein [Variovorax sp. CY25R-8]MCT8178139.1 glycoside hydrolase family 19 protein [Variovorax sp. CY25R-8]